MTLRKKTLAIVSVVVLGLILILYAISRSVLLDNFEKLEEQSTRRNVARVTDAIYADLSNMNNTAADWSAWDDTYAFVQGDLDSYIEDNMMDETFENLGLNLMLFIDTGGRTVFGKAFDLGSRQEISVPSDIYPLISKDSILLNLPNASSSRTGLVLLDEGPILVAARPIVTSAREGPIRGALILGRYLDALEVERLVGITHLDFSIGRMSNLEAPQELIQMVAASTQANPVLVQPVSRETVYGYALIEDVFGQPAVYLRVELPREIYQQGLHALAYFMSLLVAVGLVFGLLALLLLEKVVLSRVANLNASVHRQSLAGDLSERLVVTGDDELSNLGDEINRMLEALEKSELALRASERRNLIRAIPDQLFVFTKEGRCVDYKAGDEDLSASTTGGYVGKYIHEFGFSAHILEIALDGIEKALAQNTIQTFEYELIHDEPSYFEARVVALNENEVLVISRDMTARMRAQKALDKSERLYRALFELANDAIFLLNLEGIYIRGNRKTAHLLGYGKEESVGMGVKDIVAPYEYSDAQTRLDILLEGGSLPLYERIFRRKDGTEVPVEINASLIRDQDGKPLYFQIIARDITERKHAEKELKEVNRSLRVLSECNQVLVRTTEERNLLEKICRVIVQEGGYHVAWVGYSGPDDPKSIRTVAQAGLEDHPIGTIESSGPDGTENQDPAGTAIRTGNPVLVTDMRSHPQPGPWYFRALESGAVAGIALPLHANGTAIGVLNICSKEIDSFHNEQVKLLSELAEDLAFGIVTLRMRAEHQIAAEKIERQIKNLEALRNIDIAITSSLDLRMIFEILLSETIGILGVDAAAVLSYSPQSQTLDFVTAKGFTTTALQHTHLRLGESHAGQAALERRTVHIQNLNQRKTGFLRSPFLGDESFFEYFGVPLIAKGQLKGVLEIFSRTQLNPDPQWLGLLDTLAGQAAIAMDNLELFRDLQKSNADLVIAYDSTLEGWSGALDLRDKETEGHTQRVTQLSLRLARAMGVDNHDLVNIRRGALLHDIGKMGIPDRILLKPGPLAEEEWVIMRKHPAYAFELLSPIAYLRPALDIPYCHHEKWDGTGYPRGLKGEQIPLAARIFAVVDVWDALRSDRPYRKAWSEQRALEYIEAQTGKHFDPQIVKVFLQMDRDIRSDSE
ncbi:MAG TPA: HD domain-containing phosphohydrolase [Anaerolineales bacterium]|nr:HD domain-containing phosphohydrolase [Anaerolineales bacterium]